MTHRRHALTLQHYGRRRAALPSRRNVDRGEIHPHIQQFGRGYRPRSRTFVPRLSHNRHFAATGKCSHHSAFGTPAEVVRPFDHLSANGSGNRHDGRACRSALCKGCDCAASETKSGHPTAAGPNQRRRWSALGANESHALERKGKRMAQL